ncbi:MAG: outer membrane protein [Arenicella sp.]|jgi:outer membrane protein
MSLIQGRLLGTTTSKSIARARSRCFIFALATSISGNVYSQSLKESYVSALTSNIGVLDSQLAEKIASEKVKQARSFLLPQINGSARYTDRTLESSGSDQTISFFNGVSETSDYAINLDQVIFDRTLSYDLKREKKDLEIARLNTKLQHQNLILSVVKSYFDILRGVEARDSLTHEQSSISQQSKEIQSRYKLGMINKIDVLDVEAALDLVNTQLLEAQASIVQAVGALNLITGNNIEHVDKLVDTIPTHEFEFEDYDTLIELAKAHSIAIKSAEISVRKSELNHKAQRSRRLPTLKFNWSYQRSNADSIRESIFRNSTQDNNSYFINIEFPFYSGGRVNSEVRQAAFEKIQEERKLILANRTLTTDVRSDLALVKINKSRIHALTKSLSSSQRTLESTVKGHELGVRTFNDVLQVQQNYHQKIRDVAKAKYDYLESTLQLKKSLGKLGPRDIEIIDSHMNEKKVALFN